MKKIKKEYKEENNSGNEILEMYKNNILATKEAKLHFFKEFYELFLDCHYDGTLEQCFEKWYDKNLKELNK